ncbi:tetratricopeptide repeat protein, partial [candidate division KSB1 bacterium]
TVNAFFDMINRKQYAPPSVFDRQAPFYYQLQMFWNYLVIQWSPRLLAFVPLLLGIWGIQRHYRQGERRLFWAFLVLFTICSLGLVVYINFKLAPAQALDKFPDDALHEVRERDYFYTPTYYFFAVWIGLGTSALLLWFRRQAQGLKPSLRKAMTAATVLVLLGIMAVPTIYNGRQNDRSRNQVAHDFGLNLLNSVGKDGLLYTNGDNDTFPLWFLQNVKEVRQDVTVLNLSLLKTPWYPKQLKHGPTKAPISYSDQRLDRVAFAQVPKDMQIKSGNLVLPLKRGQLLSPEHQIMYDMVLTNKWERPTYFAVSVPDKGGFDDYLTLEGLVMRLTQRKAQSPFDLEACGRNITDMYSFKGVFDEDIPKDEETRARLTNYGTAFILLAEENLRRGNKDVAIPFLHHSISILSLMPENRQYQRLLQSLSQWLGEVYLEEGRFDEARAVYQRLLDLLGRSAAMSLGLGVVAHREGDYDTAVDHIREAYRQEPNNPIILNNLYIVLSEAGRTEEAREALENYIKLQPDDQRAQKLLQEMRRGSENN